MITNQNKPHIVIVGGGAGGLELAAALGKKLGKHNKVTITLVDASSTHIWKPLLHEVAAGTMNSNEDEINYFAFSSEHYFQFALGTLCGLNRQAKQIVLAPILNEKQQEILPQRSLSYDVLILAIGSVANDFSIPGVREHCLFLDNRDQADYFHEFLLNNLMRISYRASPETPFNIAVVGGGATGIELIAELHNAVHMMGNYGLTIDPQTIHFTLIEASDKLLPFLSDRLSNMVQEELKKLDVQICLGEQVTQVTDKGFLTKSGDLIPADIKVWTAGIKAPECLTQLDGLAVNKANQLLVKQTLQTTLDDAVFAMGDCASCPQTGSDKPVPPRAQAAHQQALFLVKALDKYFKGKPLPLYHYRDHGSLITLSRYEVVGNLMGILTKNLKVEGKLARLFYLSLYKKHQAALYGFWRVFLLTMANTLSRRVRPRLKLH